MKQRYEIWLNSQKDRYEFDDCLIEFILVYCKNQLWGLNHKAVERKAKWELVSTHTARRSFATNAYLAGVPTLVVMKITGHTKESAFMRYIRRSQLENANALANHPLVQAH